jgi:actin cytoskeleton-regulatory complex protein SLA1
MATEDSEEYLAVLKASYDYEPQSDEEIAIKEDQLLFLLHRTDQEYVCLEAYQQS